MILLITEGIFGASLFDVFRAGSLDKIESALNDGINIVMVILLCI